MPTLRFSSPPRRRCAPAAAPPNTEAHGRQIDEAAVLADIRSRDERDTERAIAPLKHAPDAHLLDTTHLDIDAAIRAAIDIVEATRAGRGRDYRPSLLEDKAPLAALCVRQPDRNHRSESTVIAPAIRDSRGPPKVLRGLRPARSERSFNPPAHRLQETPWPPLQHASREDFAKLLEESFGRRQPAGRLRHQGQGRRHRKGHRRHRRRRSRPKAASRCANSPGRAGRTNSRSATTVEVYLERVENALGEAVLSRDKARREESWGKLEKAFKDNEKVHGRHLQPGQGRLHRRSRRRGGLPAALAGRHPADPRRHPADERAAAVPDPEDGSPPRQHRRLAPHRAGRDPRRAAPGAGAEPRRGSGHRRRGQEHHRLRRLRRPRRHRRPAARHRHRLAARQSPDRGAQHRPAGEGQDHQDQPRDPPHLARHEAAARRSVAGHRGQVPGRHHASRAASPTSPTTAPSSSSSPASRA